MEHQLWKAIVALLRELDKAPTPARRRFGDRDVAAVYSWSVLHDRPACWACDRRHWPPPLRHRALPSPATLSRRLRTASVVALLDALQRRVTAPKRPGLFWMIDGKPLPTGGCSKDRQAGYGRSAGGKAKGYKIHALIGPDGSVAEWRLAPMNKDERVMAERLLKAAPAEVLGYVAADANYDSNDLHRLCDTHGARQLVTPRRYGPGRGTGHRQQAAGRLRSIALTEAPVPALGQRLLRDRSEIERQFGNLVNWAAGLSGLRGWGRPHRRVRGWVQAKVVLARLKRDGKIRTYVA
jgi:hypothetical protein